MFKKLFNKLMPNEEIKNDVASEENTRGAVNPESSAPAEHLEAPVETPAPKDQVPGAEVPEGHQVPGTDMSTGVSEETSSEEPDPNDPAPPKEPEVDPSKIREDQTPD